MRLVSITRPDTPRFFPWSAEPGSTAPNLRREDEGYVARFEVPGAVPEDVEIEAEGSLLRVCVRWSEDDVERRFARTLRFPKDADVAAAEATCRHGVLRVRLPLREEAKPRQIPVTVA